jgi:hypothetical protein
VSTAIASASAEPYPVATGPSEAPTRAEVRRVVWRAFWVSRLLVFFSGLFAVLEVGRAAGYKSFDPASLTSPWGYFPNLLVSPFARWDSVWYLTVSEWGYAHQEARMAFFPLYPVLMHAGGWIVGSQLLAGVLISMIAFAVSLGLFYRLAVMDFPSEVAQVAVMLLALCPVSYYFSAVYTESLFLALSLGCVYQARRGHWLACGLLGGLAAMSRNGGMMLIVPAGLIYLYGPRAAADVPLSRWAGQARGGVRRLLPRYTLRLDAVWLLLIPLGLIAYLLYLRLHDNNGLAPFHAESLWYHDLTWPFGGIWQGTVAAWDGLRQILHGPPPPTYFDKAGGNALQVAGQNLMLFAFLVAAVIAFIGGLRRLPFAYTAYTIVALGLPLTDPVSPQPLASIPRYEVVVFPLFLTIANFVHRRKITPWAMAAAAIGLGLFTAEFATWRWVA